MVFVIIANFSFKDKKIISFFGILISILFIITICFFPMPRQIELIHHMQETHEGVLNNYIPFKSIFCSVLDVFRNGSIHNFIYQVIGNIILFIPLGFFIKFFMQDKKVFLRSLISIIFISCSIESFQGLANYGLGINYRSVDIDDIILNVTGGLLGYLIAKYLQKFVLSIKQKKSFE